MNGILERFENAYSVFEERIRENYGPFSRESPVYWWEREMLSGRDRSRMKMLRELRNLFAHNPTFSEGEEVAYPTENAISFLLSELERAGTPESLGSLMVPFESVMKRKLSDNVWPSIVKMKDKDYTNIPIIDEYDMLVGIMSDSLVSDLLVRHKALCFSESLKFEDIRKDVSLSNGKIAERVMFLSPARMAYEAENLVARAWNEGRRVELLVITGNGRQSGSVLGILTPWDLLENLRSF